MIYRGCTWLLGRFLSTEPRRMPGKYFWLHHGRWISQFIWLLSDQPRNWSWYTCQMILGVVLSPMIQRYWSLDVLAHWASLKLCWKWFMPGNHWTEKPPHFEGDIFGMQGFVGFPWVSLAFLGMRQWLTNQRRFGIWATHRIWIFLISRDFIYYLFGWSRWILIGCCRISYMLVKFPWISMKYCTHALQPIATSPCFMIFFVLTRSLMNVKYTQKIWHEFQARFRGAYGACLYQVLKCKAQTVISRVTNVDMADWN